MNLFMPLLGNGEQRVHNILGSAKRQITASGEEGSSGAPSFRSLDDLKLHIMDSAGRGTDPSGLDGPRPAKLRRGIVRGQAVAAGGSLTAPAAGTSFQASSDNAGLVIEEVRDDPPVRKLIPAAAAAASAAAAAHHKRPLRIIMPSAAVKSKAAGNGTAWASAADLAGTSNGAHNVSFSPELGLSLFPQLDSQQMDKRPAGQEVNKRAAFFYLAGR